LCRSAAASPRCAWTRASARLLELSSGDQVGLSDANDEVGLLAQLHPPGDDAPLPTRYVRHDGVEVVEVPTPDGLLLVPSDLVPYDPCGGRTVGPSRNGP
jgi:hypothetical protein